MVESIRERDNGDGTGHRVCGQINRARRDRQRCASASLHLAPNETIPWHFHSAVTDWYFVLEGALSIETRAPADHRELAIGESYHIAPKTAHLIANRSDSDTCFLLVQGVGAYDFLRVGG